MNLNNKMKYLFKQFIYSATERNRYIEIILRKVFFEFWSYGSLKILSYQNTNPYKFDLNH